MLALLLGGEVHAEFFIWTGRAVVLLILFQLEVALVGLARSGCLA